MALRVLPLPLRVLLLLASAGGVDGSCADDYGCSLAGKCVAGRCQCQPWTKGDDCAALALTPLAEPASLVAAVQPAGNWTRWGSSVAEEGGQYHLFSAEMADECPLSVWGSKSTVIHSVSSSPTGPFRRLGIAIPAEAHNPVLSRDPVDGTWLLWTCGCPNPTAPPGCPRENFTCPGGQAGSWTTTVYSSKSLDGPWQPHVNLLGEALKGTTGLSQNISPLMEADGSVKLMFKGPDNNTEASILSAPHWSGPYTLIHTNIFAKYYAENITNEDVWWWRGPEGYFHALSHRMTPADRGSSVSGGHAFATSLDDWRYALTPAYTTKLDVADGSTVQLGRRERPQLLLRNGTPAVLYTAVTSTKLHEPPFTWAQTLGGGDAL
jgi:hypothetical protein|eukprot:COSAG06_NODE_4099_length_4576_cov_3.009381_3_plen_379_part_00